MIKIKNITYSAPKISTSTIELEQGIASSSASVSGGNGSTPYAPAVEDWKVGSTGGEGYAAGDL